MPTCGLPQATSTQPYTNIEDSRGRGGYLAGSSAIFAVESGAFGTRMPTRNAETRNYASPGPVARVCARASPCGGLVTVRPAANTERP